MTFLGATWKELREKRLWPVAALLVAALIAVPLLLSKSATPARVAQLPPLTPPPSPATSLPAISVQPAPGSSRLTGTGEDPFNQGTSAGNQGTSAGAASTSTSSTTGAAATGGASATGATGSSSGAVATGGSGAAGSGGTSSTSGAAPPPITPPSAKPRPAPAALQPTQSYDVTVSITNGTGGLRSIDPLERLSPLPSNRQPLLLELGVLQGGRRVMFVVAPGTVVGGPGICTPGRIDCQLLSLREDQTESVGTRSASGVSQAALFAVTRIVAVRHPSAAAADRARRAASSAGRELLSRLSLAALSLFQYEPSLGVVVDQRSLTSAWGAQVRHDTLRASLAFGQPASAGQPLQVRVLMLPQSLRAVLRSGVAIRVTSNQAAEGFAWISIPRRQARRAGFKAGRDARVVVARGTVPRIAAGTGRLTLRLSRAVTEKLGRLAQVSLTVRLLLVDAGGYRSTLELAGQY